MTKKKIRFRQSIHFVKIFLARKDESFSRDQMKKMVLGQLPRGKLPPNHKTNPKPNSNPYRGKFALRAIVWLPPNSKSNPGLDPNPNPNRGAIFLGGNCLDTEKIFIFIYISWNKTISGTILELLLSLATSLRFSKPYAWKTKFFKNVVNDIIDVVLVFLS